jgi:hypothetical protein
MTPLSMTNALAPFSGRHRLGSAGLPRGIEGFLRAGRSGGTFGRQVAAPTMGPPACLRAWTIAMTFNST